MTPFLLLVSLLGIYFAHSQQSPQFSWDIARNERIQVIRCWKENLLYIQRCHFSWTCLSFSTHYSTRFSCVDPFPELITLVVFEFVGIPYVEIESSHPVEGDINSPSNNNNDSHEQCDNTSLETQQLAAQNFTYYSPNQCTTNFSKCQKVSTRLTRAPSPQPTPLKSNEQRAWSSHKIPHLELYISMISYPQAIKTFLLDVSSNDEP